MKVRIAAIILATLMVTPLLALPGSLALAVPVHLVIVTPSGTESHNFPNVTEALNYLNNTVGYDGYISASIDVAPQEISENFTGCYVLHDLVIRGSGAANTVLYNESGTGSLCFTNSTNITLTSLTIANMTIALMVSYTDYIQILGLVIENSSEGIIAVGGNSLEANGLWLSNIVGGDTGLYLHNITRADITNAVFTAVDYPIIVENIDSLIITNITINASEVTEQGIVASNVGTMLLDRGLFKGSYSYHGVLIQGAENIVIQNSYFEIFWPGVEIEGSSGTSSIILRNLFFNYCPQSILVFNNVPGASIVLENITATVDQHYLEEEGGLIQGIYLSGYLDNLYMDDVRVEHAWWSGELGAPQNGVSGPAGWGGKLNSNSDIGTSIRPANEAVGIVLSGYPEGATIGHIELYNNTIGLAVHGGAPYEPEGSIPLYLSSISVADNFFMDIYTSPLFSREFYPASVSITTNNILVSGETALVKVVGGEGEYWVGPFIPTYGYEAPTVDIGRSNGLPPLPEGLIDTGIRFEAGAYDGYVVVGIVYPQGLINSLGIDEAGLVAYHYNSTSNEWEPLPTTVDVVHNMVYVTLNNTGSPVILLGPPLPAGVGGELMLDSLVPAWILLAASTIMLGIAVVAAIRQGAAEK